MRSEVGNIGKFIEQSVERIGDELLRAAVLQSAGQAQLEMPLGIDPQGKCGAASIGEGRTALC